MYPGGAEKRSGNDMIGALGRLHVFRHSLLLASFKAEKHQLLFTFLIPLLQTQVVSYCYSRSFL